MERAAASYHDCSCSFTDGPQRFLRRTETAAALPRFATLLAIRGPAETPSLMSGADFRSQFLGIEILEPHCLMLDQAEQVMFGLS
jgi:hypothetical protein